MTNVIQFKREESIVTKDGREFTRLLGGFGEDSAVVTDKQIAELLQYKKGARQVREQIERNIKYFVEGVDLIDLQRAPVSDTLPETLISLGYAKQSIKQAKNIYILSQAGFLLYLKFAEGDKAVEIYKDFIEDYFQTKAELQVTKQDNREKIEDLIKVKTNLLGMSVLAKNEMDNVKILRDVERINDTILTLEKDLTKEETIAKLQPKLHMFDTITNTKNSYDIGTFSKILGVKGFGRNKLFAWFRENKFLMQNNIPYQSYSKYFKVIPTTNNAGYLNNKTLLNSSAVNFVVGKLIDSGVVITKTVDQIIREMDAAV